MLSRYCPRRGSLRNRVIISTFITGSTARRQEHLQKSRTRAKKYQIKAVEATKDDFYLQLIYSELAGLSSDLEDYKNGIHYLDALLARYPDYSEKGTTINMKGRFLWKLGKYDEAINIFKQSIYYLENKGDEKGFLTLKQV